jgi:hypothetical protein
MYMCSFVFFGRAKNGIRYWYKTAPDSTVDQTHVPDAGFTFAWASNPFYKNQGFYTFGPGGRQN